MNEPVARWVAALVSVLAVALTAGACTGDREGHRQRPGPQVTYAGRDCPVEVAAALVGSVACGTLEVPENRREDEGVVRLLVTTLTPARVAAEAPLLVVGTDMATRPNYAGIATVAQRTARPVIFLEQRGTAHSEPSLSCPAETPTSLEWTVPTGSRAWRAAGAVRARDCHDYLSDHGIDVAAYGVEEMAADLADLIDVRRLAPVTLVTYGSTSRIALELLRRHSGDVRALVLDTPDLPGVDPRALAPATTASAIAKVLRWCQADRDCRTRHPEPTTLLRRAQSQLSARPLRLDAQTPTGDVRVVLDPALLVRLARQSLTDGGSAGTWGLPLALPRLFTAVLRSDRPRLRLALGELLGAQGPWCAGYRNKCMSSHVVDEGVWNTVLCRDIAPFTSPDAPRTASRPGFRQAYDDSWWWDVCSHWPVPPASATTAEPLITDVPVLVLVGGLAAPVPEETIRRWTARMPHVSIVVDPTGSHNVLGIGCMGEIRDGWLTDPHPVPVHPACAATRLEW